jgi:hypothetical protein
MEGRGRGADKEENIIDTNMVLTTEIQDLQSENITENDENKMETGLAEAVDLTLTAEEIEFKLKPSEPIDPTAYAHNKVI